MPGNIITVNGIEYYLGDCNMEGLLKYLNEKGYPVPGLRESTNEVKPEDRPYSDQDWFTEGYDKGLLNGMALAEHAVNKRRESMEAENKERVTAYMKRETEARRAALLKKRGVGFIDRLYDLENSNETLEAKAYEKGYVIGYDKGIGRDHTMRQEIKDTRKENQPMKIIHIAVSSDFIETILKQGEIPGVTQANPLPDDAELISTEYSSKDKTTHIYFKTETSKGTLLLEGQVMIGIPITDMEFRRT